MKDKVKQILLDERKRIVETGTGVSPYTFSLPLACERACFTDLFHLPVWVTARSIMTEGDRLENTQGRTLHSKDCSISLSEDELMNIRREGEGERQKRVDKTERERAREKEKERKRKKERKSVCERERERERECV